MIVRFLWLELPGHFYAQVKDQGLLLIAIKTEGEGDNLFLLRRNQDHFESLESQAAGCPDEG
jgi:hypothetical protein